MIDVDRDAMECVVRNQGPHLLSLQLDAYPAVVVSARPDIGVLEEHIVDDPHTVAIFIAIDPRPS